MAKNKAHHVSLVTFAEKYYATLKSGGTIVDLMNAVEMENLGSVRQKIVQLKKEMPNLPSLKRQGRTTTNGQSVGQAAASRLAELFASEANETAESNETAETAETADEMEEVTA